MHNALFLLLTLKCVLMVTFDENRVVFKSKIFKVYLKHTCNSSTLIKYVTLEHKSSVKSLGYICSNNQEYIVWVKIIDFSFMPKIIRILRSCSIKILVNFPTVNISKRIFWLIICIAKNLIWTTLTMIFSIFFYFFAFSDSRFSNIVQTIHQWKYDLFSFQMMHKSQFHKMYPYDWFCAPGSHILINI